MPWVALAGRLEYEVQVLVDGVVVPPADYEAESITVTIDEFGKIDLVAPNPGPDGSLEARVVLAAPSRHRVRFTGVMTSTEPEDKAAVKYYDDEIVQSIAESSGTIEFEAGEWDAVGYTGSPAGGE